MLANIGPVIGSSPFDDGALLAKNNWMHFLQYQGLAMQVLIKIRSPHIRTNFSSTVKQICSKLHRIYESAFKKC